MKPQVSQIYKDDCDELYHVIDVFSNSCVVEPLVNTGCFCSEIMSFKAMSDEGWQLIGYTTILEADAPSEPALETKEKSDTEISALKPEPLPEPVTEAVEAPEAVDYVEEEEYPKRKHKKY
jgi:hypothetical protein